MHDVVHKPLASSTRSGEAALVAKCDACVGCGKSWCFSFADDGLLMVETCGECNGQRNDARLRLDNAKKYAHLSAGKAIMEMMKDKVPISERPSAKQLENQRLSVKKKQDPVHYPAVCLGALQMFLDSPPDHVHVFSDSVICDQKKVRIPFASVKVREAIRGSRLTSFLMDFTFSTNKEGLVLGAAGPVGLVPTPNGPSMRFIPLIFVLADAEDQEAHQL